jgi:ribosomal protein S4E
MEFNVNALKNTLRKATLNFSIESVQLLITKDRVVSKMISDHRDAVVELDLPNDIMDLKKGSEYEFNFSQPNANLIPFLNLIDSETADISIKNEKVVISDGNQRSNIHFCSPDVVSVFTGKLEKSLEFFMTLEIDDTILQAFNKIKKVATKFGNIYFNVEDGRFNIETSDRSNRFSNNLKFDITDADYKDVSLKFDFKTFLNMLNVINGSAEEFTMKFSYVESSERGLILTEKADNTEIYYLMSLGMENET